MITSLMQVVRGRSYFNPKYDLFRTKKFVSKPNQWATIWQQSKSQKKTVYKNIMSYTACEKQTLFWMSSQMQISAYHY